MTKSSQFLVTLLLLTSAASAFQHVRYQPAFVRSNTGTAAMSQPSLLLPMGARDKSLKLAFQVNSHNAGGDRRRSAFHRKLSMSKDDSNNDEAPSAEEAALSKKIAGRKKRVLIGYRLCTIKYALLGVATLVPAFVKPSLAAVALTYSGGPVLAAGIAYILTGAAKNDRLSSDTYKRLNLMLSQFGFLWLLAGILVKQTQPMSRGAKIICNPLVVLANISALVNGIKGWGYGVKGWDKKGSTSYTSDLVNMVKTSWHVFTMAPIPTVNAGFYLAATLFAASLLVLRVVGLFELLANLASPDITAAKFGSWVIAFAKIKLLAGAVFTLLDASQRDRLQGTTFIELNAFTSFVWLGMGAYLFTSGQVALASLATVFSSFSVFTGVNSYLMKKQAS